MAKLVLPQLNMLKQFLTDEDPILVLSEVYTLVCQRNQNILGALQYVISLLTVTSCGL